MLARLVAALGRRLLPPSETLDGYEHPELVETIFQKTRAYTPDAAGWPEMVGAASVLDFGGGCGIHHRQANDPAIRWAVVETPAMVARAEELATDRLRFFPSIAGAADWLGSIDVMYSNGALQYLPHPLLALTELCGLRARRMVWDRVSLSQDETHHDVQVSMLGDNGPGRSTTLIRDKKVAYTRTSVPQPAFLDAHRGYDLVEHGPSWFRFRRD